MDDQKLIRARSLADALADNERLAGVAGRLHKALENTAPRLGPNLGPCWCPASVKDIPTREEDHGVLCIEFRAAWRAGKATP